MGYVFLMCIILTSACPTEAGANPGSMLDPMPQFESQSMNQWDRYDRMSQFTTGMNPWSTFQLTSPEMMPKLYDPTGKQFMYSPIMSQKSPFDISSQFTIPGIEKLKEDTEVATAYKKYFVSWLRRECEKMTEQRWVITWTNRIGLLIFAVVHAVLALALWVALSEFRHAMRTRKQGKQSQEIEISLQKIALKTSLHGTVLLIAALAFYFMFVKFVYPITFLG